MPNGQDLKEHCPDVSRPHMMRFGDPFLRAELNTLFRRFGPPIVISREAQQCVLSPLVPHMLCEIAYFRGVLAPSLGISMNPCHGTKA